jgi:DNA-binding transcriptional ArsR family regulator
VTYEVALSALADATRRGVFERLRKRPHTVGELARLAGVSQPAISQHLRVLRRARLVTHESEGTRRHYRATAEGLAALRTYVESMWGDVLSAYAAEDPAPPNPKKQRRRP